METSEVPTITEPIEQPEGEPIIEPVPVLETEPVEYPSFGLPFTIPFCIR